MLRRRRGAPFIASVIQMRRGDYGWQRLRAGPGPAWLQRTVELAGLKPPPGRAWVMEEQRWSNQFGGARVVAVRCRYAMMKRRRSNPFIKPVVELLDGVTGWRLAEPADEAQAA